MKNRSLVPGLIETAILDYLREDEDDGFHTFEVGEYYPHTVGFCPLRYYYIYRYVRRVDLPDEALNRVAVGKVAHAIVQSALAERGYEIEKEVSMDLGDGARLRGRVDAFYPGSDDVPRHVVEIKTVADLHLVRDGPFDHHLYQMEAYLRMTDSPMGIFVYVSRSSFKRRYWEVYPSDSRWNAVLSWVRTVHSALVSATPPSPRPVADWECSTCPLRNTCPYHNIGSQLRLEI